MVVLFMLIPLVVGLITVGAVLVTLISIWCQAIGETINSPHGRKPPARAIPGFYVPRWGAYRRGSTAREHARWVEDFAMAESLASSRQAA